MSRPPRILHLADTHIGAELPARPRVDRPRRGDDFIRSFRAALAHAITGEGVDLVLHAGDLFDMPVPSAAAITAAADALLEVADAGVPVVIVPGNHERCAIPGSVLFAHPNLHVVRQPTTMRFDLRGVAVSIAALPCIRRGVREAFEEQLAATAWREQRGDVNILALHQTIESATCGPANFRFRSGDDVINRPTIPAEFDYVALGHIHRQQVIRRTDGDGPPLVYSGSTDRITFAEVDEPKGVMLLDLTSHGVVSRFVEHNVRPMAMLPLDVSGRTKQQVIDAVTRWLAELPEAAMAQVRLTGQTTPREMRGLALARHAEATRRDVLFSANSQSLLFVPERTVAAASARRENAFADVVGGEVRPPIVANIDRIDEIPRTCGTYAFFDADERLLYVGKAKIARTRLRSHLAQKGGGYYAAWVRQIASVALWPADCELEALLREADLIRRLRPPFNSQMRSWARYCYLCRGERGEWFVSPQVVAGDACFGPLRSRRTAEEIAAAIGVLSDPATLLRGESDAEVLALATVLGIAEIESNELYISDDPRHRAIALLRQAFDMARAAADAEALAGGLLLFPSSDPSRQMSVILSRGRCIWRARITPELLTDWKAEADRLDVQPQLRLVKAVADAYSLVARQLRRGDSGCIFLPRGGASSMTLAQLAAAAPPLIEPTPTRRGRKSAAPASAALPSEAISDTMRLKQMARSLY